MKRIHINRIEIRIRGVSPHLVSSALYGFKDTLSQKLLTTLMPLPGKTKNVHIHDVYADAVKMKTPLDIQAIQEKIAGGIIQSIYSQLHPGNKGGTHG